MPKRYYCAYCCKSFQDTPRNRKRHLSGVSHQRLKQHHYDSIVPEFKPSTTSILYSNLTGKEILDQWIANHPGVRERYQKFKASKT